MNYENVGPDEEEEEEEESESESKCDSSCDMGSCNFYVSLEKGKAKKEQKILLTVRPDSIQYELTKGKDWFGLYLRDLERYCNYLEEKELNR